MILKSLHKLQRITWYVMIASLPLTSMPLVKKILGSDSVASPAVVFLLVLFCLWAAGLIFGDKLGGSAQILPLALFCCAAVIATLISIFYKTPAFKDFGQISPVVSALGTLAIGFIFFFMASSFPIDDEIKKADLENHQLVGIGHPYLVRISGNCMVRHQSLPSVDVLNSRYAFGTRLIPAESHWIRFGTFLACTPAEYALFAFLDRILSDWILEPFISNPKDQF